MSTEGDTTTDLLWQRARYHYENHTETVKAIAEGLGLSASQLVAQAKQRNWKLRNSKQKKTKPVQTTRATLHRVKELLQSRLTAFESQLQEPAGDSPTPFNATAGEREMRAMNTLVRTMEKVLELERYDQTRRRRKNTDRQKFDDAARDELAARIEKLQKQCLAAESAQPIDQRRDLPSAE